jgi:hypothetical protein
VINQGVLKAEIKQFKVMSMDILNTMSNDVNTDSRTMHVNRPRRPPAVRLILHRSIRSTDLESADTGPTSVKCNF